jgi:hypothetical protein
MREGRYIIGGNTENVFIGQDDGSTWNGWQNPELRPDEMPRFLDTLRDADEGAGFEATWVWDGTDFLYTVWEDGDIAESASFGPNDHGYYPVGHGYTWERVEDVITTAGPMRA